MIAPETEQTAAFDDDDRGINGELLKALPSARQVLELGCADGVLGRRYKRSHPLAAWIGVDVNAAALAVASERLDAVVALDLDRESIARVGTGFDLVVLGDVLEHLKAPGVLLAELRAICTDDARLVCCMPNMSHISVIERLIRGDIMYDDVGLLDETHLRFFSARSVFKMLLDAGWLPDAVGGYAGGHANAAFAQSIVAAAQALDIPQAAAELNVYTYQLIIRCTPRPSSPVARARGNLTVIVACDDAAQLDLNLMRSPGLREIDAEVVTYRDARSAAAGFAAGAARARGEWLLFCHPNMYFPRGSGAELGALLERITVADAPATILGFSGVAVDASLQPIRAGLMVAGRTLMDFPASDRAISIADCAVVLHRDNPLRIDPALGNHLWATDVCLQSIYGPSARFPQIVRVPVFHNSVDAGALSQAYLTSAQALARKYPRLPAISTLDGNIDNDGRVHPSTALPGSAIPMRADAYR